MQKGEYERIARYGLVQLPYAPHLIAFIHSIFVFREIPPRPYHSEVPTGLSYFTLKVPY